MIYEQKTGRLTSDLGSLFGVGYAGFGIGKNNPEKYQHSHDQAMKKYNKKKQKLTNFQTDHQTPAKKVRKAVK